MGELAVIGYEQLISEFHNSGAVLVPVMWGEKKVSLRQAPVT